MEVVRPDVDAFVLDWKGRGPLPRNHFFEQRDGNCRLMASFASTLSQTATTLFGVNINLCALTGDPASNSYVGLRYRLAPLLVP